MPNTNNLKKFAVLIFIAISLLSCKEEVATGINSFEANKLSSLLYSYGVASEQIDKGNDKWSIRVDKDYFNLALDLISQLSFKSKENKKKEDGGFLFGGEGDQDLKINDTLAIQTEKLLEALPGVFSANIVVTSSLNLLKQNKEEDVNKDQRERSASLVLITFRGYSAQPEDVFKLVANSTGIIKENINLLMKTVETKSAEESLEEKIVFFGIINKREFIIPSIIIFILSLIPILYNKKKRHSNLSKDGLIQKRVFPFKVIDEV